MAMLSSFEYNYDNRKAMLTLLRNQRYNLERDADEAVPFLVVVKPMLPMQVLLGKQVLTLKQNF